MSSPKETSQAESRTLLQKLSDVTLESKTTHEDLSIHFAVNPLIFGILRDCGEIHGITAAEAARSIVVDWVQKVWDAQLPAESEQADDASGRDDSDGARQRLLDFADKKGQA